MLRRLFNERGLADAARRRELKVVPQGNDKLAPSHIRNWVPGTLSQMRRYVQPGVGKVALVHQYQRPDGTLAASGMPDPKWLRDGERILTPAHKDDEVCDDCAKERPSHA